MTAPPKGYEVSEVPSPPSKLALDKVVSGLLLAFSAPVWVVIVAAQVLEAIVSPRARGPLFHTEERVSAGVPFRLYKFRILTRHAEAEIRAGGRPKAVENRPGNLTGVGAVLKRIGLDELPQLVHVLTGTMSMVGPRPKPVAEYHEQLALGNTYRAKLRAGLTGPTQILKGTDPATRRPDEDEFAYLELLESGAQLRILRTDLRIIARTVRVLLQATGE